MWPQRPLQQIQALQWVTQVVARRGEKAGFGTISSFRCSQRFLQPCLTLHEHRFVPTAFGKKRCKNQRAEREGYDGSLSRRDAFADWIVWVAENTDAEC